MARVTHRNGELQINSAHDGMVWPLLFGRLSSDEIILVSGAAHPDYRLCCWDAATGRLLWASQESEIFHGCFDLSVVRARDDRDVLAAATEVGVQRWEARSGIRLQDVDDLNPGTIWGLDSYVMGDGRSLLVGAGNDHLVYRWDAVSGARAGVPLSGHQSSVKCVAIDVVPGRGVLIASGSDDGTVRRWDGVTGECIGVSDATNAEILDIELIVPRAGVPVLTCADSDGMLHRWDAVTGDSLGSPIETGEMVGSLASVEVLGEPRIVASSASGIVRHWHALTGRPMDESSTGMSVATVVDADGRALFAAGSKDGDISIRAVPLANEWRTSGGQASPL